MAEANGDPPENGAAPVAFGFAKTAQKRKVAVNIEDKPKEKRQAITGFAGGSAVVADGAGEEEEGRQAPLVIPKLENTYKTGVGRKMVPSFRPPENDVASIAAGADRFEVAKLDTRPTVTGYGLERRARPQAEGETAANGQASTQPPPQQQGPRLTPQDLERQAYKQDVEALPNAPRTEVRGVQWPFHTPWPAHGHTDHQDQQRYCPALIASLQQDEGMVQRARSLGSERPHTCGTLRAGVRVHAR